MVEGKKPAPLPLEELPVEEACELYQLMAHIDQVHEPRTEKIVLLGRARAVLHRGTQIAGFWAKSYETLHVKSTKTSRSRQKIRGFDVVQAELSRHEWSPD